MKRTAELNTFDGTRLYYSVEGEGPVDFLLSDGIGCDGFVWRYLRPELLTCGRVIHMHMRGHGRSDPPADPTAIGIHHVADDWAEIMRAEGVTRAVVLGHSMGVQVALELWHRHPEHIAGLVLLCGSFENPVATFHDAPNAQRLFPFMRRGSQLGGRVVKAAWRKLVALPLAYHVARMTEVHPDLVRRGDFKPYLDHLSKMDPAIFFAMLGGAAEHSARPYLADIDVPVLVVSGDRDQFTPARLSAEMASQIPRGHGLEIKEGTHTAPIEHPVEVRLAVNDFLRDKVGL